MKSHLVRLASLVIFANFLSGCGEGGTGSGDKISYSLQVKPILSDRCFQCHGPDAGSRKAGLQLDNAEAAFKALKEGGHPIVPGAASESVAYNRITSDDPEFIMPPPSSHMTVSAEEAEIIRQWIDQGAVYEKHWAYIPPEKSALPKTTKADWPINPIDNFVLAKVEAAGLAPAQPADKATLIRRAFLDLIGIIPSIEQLDKYMSDQRADYFSYLVDDLLASPQYGEHMAASWLDLARYGDTHGYQNDFARQMWPWRNWVIKAYNENMSFDQFMMQQLAGDLMDNPTQDMLLATAFNRNTLVSSEEGIIHEEFRVEYVADKVDATSTTFLGHTVGCARCHDHKYDPVSQKDFYSMFAFFNNTREFGIVKSRAEAHPPYMNYFNQTEHKDQFDQLVLQIDKQDQTLRAMEEDNFAAYKARLENEMDAIPADVIAELRGDDALTYNALENEIPGASDTLLVPGKFGHALRIGSEPISIGYSFAFVGKAIDVKKTDKLGISVWTRRPTLKATEIVEVAKPEEDIPEEEKAILELTVEKPQLRNHFALLEQIDMGKEQRGFGLRITTDDKLQFVVTTSWPKNSIEVRSKMSLENLSDWQHIYGEYDGSGKAEGIRLYVGGEQVATEIIKDELTGDIDNINPLLSGWGYDSKPAGSISHEVDEIRLYHNKALSAAAIKVLAEASSPAINAAIAGGVAALKDNQHIPAEYMADNQEYVTGTDNWFNQLNKKRAMIKDHSMPMMVMADYADNETHRPSYLLKRGSYEQPDLSEELIPNIPLEFGSLGDDRPNNRLGLAQWLASDENTLTARVTVNRFWQALFGKGIVQTSENFGSQGSLPTHPKLLDWLAIEFIQSGWDTKHMLKLMVMSRTYQQDSSLPDITPTPDPENLLLSRGPMFRMSAEMIRDSVLQSAELLSSAIGGKSVKPYQPAGLWRELTTFDVYKHDVGENLYRRGLYSYWKRTLPVPSMLLFDAPTRSISNPRRQPTNTPLQALVLLNDPQYVEAARVLAQNAFIRNDQTDSRIQFIAKSLLSRDLTITEMEGLTGLHLDMMLDFSENADAADGFLSIGDFELPAQALQSSEDVAALAVVATAVMNLSEFITRR